MKLFTGLFAFHLLAIGQPVIGNIEFYGYKGIDVAKLRESLPVHPGDPMSSQTKEAIRKAVPNTTDVAGVCCNEMGRGMYYIGLSGESSKKFAYNPDPQGKARLPADIIALYDRLDQAIEAAVNKGGSASGEDDSLGYSLINDPAARKLQLEMRQWAIEPAHLRLMLSVLQESSVVKDRQVASQALGYASQSKQQILGLVGAARDSDGEVRNNATRALGVLASSSPSIASSIPAEPFVEMLFSPIWSDRNKSAMVLEKLSASRDPKLLAKLRANALDPLIEMASWQGPSHSYTARMILGRVGGIPDERLQKLALNGPVKELVDAALAKP